MALRDDDAMVAFLRKTGGTPAEVLTLRLRIPAAEQAAAVRERLVFVDRRLPKVSVSVVDRVGGDVVEGLHRAFDCHSKQFPGALHVRGPKLVVGKQGVDMRAVVVDGADSVRQSPPGVRVEAQSRLGEVRGYADDPGMGRHVEAAVGREVVEHPLPGVFGIAGSHQAVDPGKGVAQEVLREVGAEKPGRAGQQDVVVHAVRRRRGTGRHGEPGVERRVPGEPVVGPHPDRSGARRLEETAVPQRPQAVLRGFGDEPHVVVRVAGRQEADPCLQHVDPSRREQVEEQIEGDRETLEAVFALADEAEHRREMHDPQREALAAHWPPSTVSMNSARPATAPIGSPPPRILP